jgi:ferredoxin
MASTENFDIIAFHSRQHALRFSEILNEHCIPSQLMSTPKEISLGCGLCLRISPYKTPEAIEIYHEHSYPIIGFYNVKRVGTRSHLVRIPHDK